MKKKFFAMFLVATMLATLTACGGTSNEAVENNEAVVEEPTEAEETVEENSENSEAVLESTETASDEAVSETVETETASDEAVEEPVVEENSEAVTEPAAPAYTYTDMSVTMYAQSSVNVRDLPSTDGEKVGSLKTNDEVSVTGQCNETGWYRIAYGDGEAYVSNNYLGDNKVEVQQSAQNTQTSDNSSSQITSTSTTSNIFPYELSKVYGDLENGYYVYWDGVSVERDPAYPDIEGENAFSQAWYLVKNACMEVYGTNVGHMEDGNYGAGTYDGIGVVHVYWVKMK